MLRNVQTGAIRTQKPLFRGKYALQQVYEAGTWRARTRVQTARLGESMPQGGERTNPDRLIEAIAARGDRDAFAALFNHFAPRIKSLLVRSGSTPEAAEDIAHEAMIAVWRKAGMFDATRASAEREREFLFDQDVARLEREHRRALLGNHMLDAAHAARELDELRRFGDGRDVRVWPLGE